MAVLFELPWLLAWPGLSQLDGPLSLLVIPIAADDLRVECHVLPQAKGFADLVEVFPDVRTVAEEARPVRVECKLVCVGM